ncbi:Retinol dehydrogenase 11, partial [Operophtera brumata]
MARPSTASIAARNIIQQFHRRRGNMPAADHPLPNYGEASLSGLLDMAKVLSFALQEGRVAIHCHAVYSILTKGRCKSSAKLHGKVALITGGNSGIGLETARDLARRGATVIVASRDEEKSSKAVSDIIKTTGNKNVEHKFLDLAKFSSVRKFAEDFEKSFDRLDILVNNAGCAGLKHRITEDGINIVMQINYFGPFLLTNLLKKKLIASKPSRIVVVSSKAHQYAKFDIEDIKGLNEIHYFANYSNSKLCNVLWAKALSNDLPDGVTANALHPGVVKTDIFNRIPPLLRKVVLFLIGAIFKSAEEGAQTSIQLAVAEELENKTGGYYSECVRTAESDLAMEQELIEKIVYCLCERLLKLCGCHHSAGLDFRVRSRPFYKNFLVFKRELLYFQAFIADHKYLPEEKQKYLKQLRNEINRRREGFARIDE